MPKNTDDRTPVEKLSDGLKQRLKLKGKAIAKSDKRPKTKKRPSDRGSMLGP